ncbi:MAG: phosphocholine cytidylyltransferase family protein [Myxococcota bacterium]
MKAIVLAAGMGKRLGNRTVDRPKCMVPLCGRPILEHQARAFRAAGVHDIVVVRGHAAASVRLDGARIVENREFATSNILASLLCAADELCGELLLSYGDIVFAPDVVALLVAAPGDLCLVVDRDWARVYEGRDAHPIAQAELCRVEDGRILRLGKCVGQDGAHGEFIGLMKASADGAWRLREAGLAVARSYRERQDEPFADAPRYRMAYLCDLLQHMADGGERLTPVDIHGRWREIDTPQDFDRAERDIDWLD